MANEKLEALRDEIDGIDHTLIALLNKRAQTAQEIGKAKKGSSMYDPAREKAVLGKIIAANAGPLSNDMAKNIFKEIIAACRAIQQPLQVAYLGPEGTYSEEAAREYCGSSCHYLPYASIDEVVRAAESGRSDIAVVPIENSSEGTVNRTLDLLLDSPLAICGEVVLPIHHQLLTQAVALEKVTQVCAHPQALAQCRIWLSSHLPGVQQTSTVSNAAAAQMVAHNPTMAAIAGVQAAIQYNLPVLAQNIEDSPTNATRFAVLGKSHSGPTSQDKTSLVWVIDNRPGAFGNTLAVLAENNINIVKLESRPLKENPWEYVFYVDIDGHEQDHMVDKTLQELKQRVRFLKVLGSYPKAD